MTEAVATAETSDNAPQASTTGDQLEGKKSDTLTAKQAADMFKGSILGEKNTGNDAASPKSEEGQAPEKDKPKTEEDNTTTETDEPIEDGDEADEEGQSEEESDDVEAGADADDYAEEGEEEGAATDEGLYPVIVDGEEIEVTYDELVSGYQRQADYTRKSMELAEQRKALETEKDQIADLPRVKEAYETETKRFGQNAELVLVAFENGFMPQAPAEELRNTDPAQYLLQKEKHQEALQFVHGLRGEMQKVQDQAQQDHAKLVQQGRQELLQLQPQLQDAQVRGKFQQYILDQGFTEQQIKQEASPRLFEFAFKAMKYDELMERSKAKPEPKKKRPKVMKNKKASEDASSIATKRKSEARNRHQTKKTMKSASDAISQSIKNAHNRRKR